MILGTSKKEDSSYANANCTHRCQYDRYRLSYGMAFGLVVIFISSLNAQKITNAIFRGKGL